MAPLYEQTLPVLRDRVFVFSLLVDSIAHCEQLGSAAWSVTQLDDGFRLNVGQVEALTCRFSFWHEGESDLDLPTTQVNLRLLLAGEDCLSKIALPQEDADIAELFYSSVGERHWCYRGSFDAGVDDAAETKWSLVGEHTTALRASHHAFLNLACLTSTGKLRQKSNFARSDCVALYEYATNVVCGAVQAPLVGEVAEAKGEGINPLLRIRIEKAAADSGFELSAAWSGDTARLRSVQFPETVGVQHRGGDEFSVSASNPAVLAQGDSSGAIGVSGWAALYEVLGKVSATARTLPNRVAQQFSKQAATLPQSTEAERWVVQRVGQDLFRAALLDYWRGKCCVTGLALPGLLRASHIRPWSQCETDEQRLDVFNGLLLAPHLDALFDDGWISFSEDGAVMVSPTLGDEARLAMGVSVQWAVRGLVRSHKHYLEYHRQHLWRGA